MLLITGTIRIPPENLPRARKAMQAMILASRAENGCLDYAYSQDILEPGLIHVNERWSDQAALDLHFASEHIAVWRSSWPQLGIFDRNLQLYLVETARPT